MATRAKMEDRQADLIWAAGFMDGEGCFTVQRTKRVKDNSAYYQPLIDVAQIKPEPLEALVMLFGGKVYLRTRGGRKYYFWRVYNEKAACACSALLPYLRVKQDQARIIVELQATRGKRGLYVKDAVFHRRQELFAAIRRLNAGNSARRAERLSELAPLIEEDATVRSHGKNNHETPAEMTGALRMVK